MNSNREIVSFPFKPHLAKYLFYSMKNEIVETEETLSRHLDIHCHSHDGFFLRSLFSKRDYPQLKQPEKGYRLTVTIPKQSSHPDLVEDGRSSNLYLEDKVIKKINAHYEARFRDHFVSFVSGAVYGAGEKKRCRINAILFFMDRYDLHQHFTLDQLSKYYDRTLIPTKSLEKRTHKNKKGSPKGAKNALNRFIDK